MLSAPLISIFYVDLVLVKIIAITAQDAIFLRTLFRTSQQPCKVRQVFNIII